MKAWIKLAPTPELVTAMLVALEAQAADRHLKIRRRQWVPELPYPASWLRGERWNDELQAPEPRMTLGNDRGATHVQKTQQVKQLIAEGLSPAEATRKVYGA